MTTPFFYVSAPAGSGKTYNLAHHAIAEAARGTKLLIAQPTNELIDQTVSTIRLNSPTTPLRVITGATTTGSVSSTIQAHLEAADPLRGEVLFISHEALNRLSPSHRKFWKLVVDEIPGVVEHMNLPIGDTHGFATSLIEPAEMASGLSVLQPRQLSVLDERIANRKGDINTRNFQPLFAAIRSQVKEVFVASDRYASLLNDPDFDGNMDFFSLTLPAAYDGFADVTFMAANAEFTELMVVWSDFLGVKFKPHPTLGKGLATEHVNGPLLKLEYLFDISLSKRTKAKANDDGLIGNQLQASILANMQGEPFLWQTNKGEAWLQAPWQNQLPGVAHGLDKAGWKAINNVVLLAAMNRRPAAYGFFDKLGIKSYRVHAMLGHQNDYQAMMRSALRDPTNKREVRVIVGSKSSALWLAERFPGCSEPIQFNHGIAAPRSAGRPKGPKPPVSSTERSRKSRAAKAAKGARFH